MQPRLEAAVLELAKQVVELLKALPVMEIGKTAAKGFLKDIAFVVTVGAAGDGPLRPLGTACSLDNQATTAALCAASSPLRSHGGAVYKSPAQNNFWKKAPPDAFLCLCLAEAVHLPAAHLCPASGQLCAAGGGAA